MKRHTILHFIHTGGAGGAETVFQQLIHHLDDRAWRSVAVVPAGGWLDDQLRSAPAEVVPLEMGGAFDAALLGQVVRAAGHYDVDLIQTHLLGPAVYGTLAATLLDLPVVSTMHGSIDLASARKWGGVKSRILKRRRNRFVAVTQALLHEMIEGLRVEPSQARVISNGVDLAAFFPNRSRSLRREFGWTGDEILIGAVGNVRYPKAYHHLLEAANLLRHSCPRCRFVILGDTAGEAALYRELLEQRRSLGLEESVVFAGFRDDVNEALNNLDIYVLSSTREGLPLAILQAMAAKLPIVATRCGGPQEVLTHDWDALLVPPGDPRALAEGLATLAHDPALRDRLADAALATATTKYSLSRVAGAYAETYADSLGHQGPRAPQTAGAEGGSA
jgi:glycosyltransferase involved in cell wall biosynthesis